MPDVVITDEMLKKARASAGDQVLEELSGFYLFSKPEWSDEKHVIRVAEKLLNGDVEIPGYPATRSTMPFDDEDLDRGSTTWQLVHAGFIIPEILPRAYQLTERDHGF